jgi:hypothetical protein
MREMLAEKRPDGPTQAELPHWTSWSSRSTDPESAVVKECFNEMIAKFVDYADKLMAALQATVARALPAIEAEFAPLGVSVGPRGTHVFHKTHAAPRPPATEGLHLVPLSGGVYQLMVELRGPTGEMFDWNIVDLECDWKSAKPACHPEGRAFETVTVPDDGAAPERGLRLLAPAPLRKDLDPEYQAAKNRRRELKRRYWDWAAARHAAANSAAPAAGAAATGGASPCVPFKGCSAS